MAISDFLDFMPETVTINAYVSVSVSGVKTYSPTTQSFSCRIELENHIVLDRSGREVTARGTIFLGTTTVPGISDLLTLPSSYSPQTPPILAVNPVSDESGIHHVELHIG